MKNNTKKIFLNILCFGFIIASAMFFSKGNDCKNPYDYNNMYVGGDAYNYIINYENATGFYTIGTGTIICATLCGISSITLKKDKIEDKNNGL